MKRQSNAASPRIGNSFLAAEVSSIDAGTSRDTHPSTYATTCSDVGGPLFVHWVSMPGGATVSAHTYKYTMTDRMEPGKRPCLQHT